MTTNPHERFVWIWFWMLVGLIAAIFVTWLVYSPADAQSLREIVTQSEQPTAPAPALTPTLPWKTFAEVYKDFQGATIHPICGDIEDSYLAYATHGETNWIWFWGNDRFTLSEFASDRSLVRVFLGHISGGQLVISRMIAQADLPEGSTPCQWFRGQEF